MGWGLGFGGLGVRVWGLGIAVSYFPSGGVGGPPRVKRLQHDRASERERERERELLGRLEEDMGAWGFQRKGRGSFAWRFTACLAPLSESRSEGVLCQRGLCRLPCFLGGGHVEYGCKDAGVFLSEKHEG